LNKRGARQQNRNLEIATLDGERLHHVRQWNIHILAKTRHDPGVNRLGTNLVQNEDRDH
jgi:hypothetical protein